MKIIIGVLAITIMLVVLTGCTEPTDTTSSNLGTSSEQSVEEILQETPSSEEWDTMVGLASEDPGIRDKSFSEIIASGTKSIPALRQWILDPNISCTQKVLHMNMLVHIKGEASLFVLNEVLKSPFESKCIQAAISVSQQLNNAETRSILLQLASEHSDSGVRYMARMVERDIRENSPELKHAVVSVELSDISSKVGETIEIFIKIDTYQSVPKAKLLIYVSDNAEVESGQQGVEYAPLKKGITTEKLILRVKEKGDVNVRARLKMYLDDNLYEDVQASGKIKIVP